MKYSVKQIDGEWCVVDKDTDDIIADATDRKDAVLQASALNREESNSESKPKFHRGSSYGNKPEAELSEGSVSDGIDKAIDLMYELTDDGQMAKNAYHEAKAKFKLGTAEAEIVLDIWNDSHKSDRRNFIEVDTINEKSEEYGGSIIPAYHVATDRMGNVTITKDHAGNVYLQGDEATDFKRQLNRLKTNKVSEDKILNFLSQYDDVMQESQEVNKLTKELEEMEIDEAGRTPKEVDEIAVRELVLYAENDADLYRQSALPIIANLQRKVKKGTYDAELAIKLWRYHADRAAKKYIQEFDGEFSPATRNAAAKEFRDGYDEEVQSVLDESSIEEANGKEQLTPELAKGILNDLEIGDKDFFTLPSSKVSELLDVAKQYGYRKSKYAPGSTARMFHQYIQRLAKKAKGEEINELSKDTLGSYVKKAAFDNGMAGFRQGKAVGDAGKYHKRPDNATANAEARRGEKRIKGIDRAVKRLTNESQEEINESFEKKMTREIAQKIIRDDLGIQTYTHDYQFTQLSLKQIIKLSELSREYGFELDRMAPLSLEASFWKSLQYVIKTGRSIGSNNENESQEEINESFSKLTDKQLQDKFIELKVKAKDLSKDSKESKQLQKIRDEIKKRKDSPKQEIKESLNLEDTIISIIKS